MVQIQAEIIEENQELALEKLPRCKEPAIKLVESPKHIKE